MTNQELEKEYKNLVSAIRKLIKAVRILTDEVKAIDARSRERIW